MAQELRAAGAAEEAMDPVAGPRLRRGRGQSRRRFGAEAAMGRGRCKGARGH